MTVETNLYDFVAPMLMELVWAKGYQLHPGVATWGFLEAWRLKGDDVDLGELNSDNRITVSIERNGMSGSAVFTPEEILKGWGWGLPGSPSTTYDAICMVYDKIEPTLPERRQDEWHMLREHERGSLRKLMEESWMPLFHKYQEHVLVSVDGTVSELIDPRIIYQVLREYPIDVFTRTGLPGHTSEQRCTPTMEGLFYGEKEEVEAETVEGMLDVDWSRFETPHHPSKATMMELFQGLYMSRLAGQKGYAPGVKPTSIVMSGQSALKTATELRSRKCQTKY
jgi:hypothetical protein